MRDEARSYVHAWLALLVFTALSFGLDHLHLGSIGTALALAIAALKASIVLMISCICAASHFRFASWPSSTSRGSCSCIGIAFDVRGG